MIYGTNRAICVNCDEPLPRAAAGRCPICLVALSRAEEPAIACRQCGETSTRKGTEDCLLCQPGALNDLGYNEGKRIRS